MLCYKEENRHDTKCVFFSCTENAVTTGFSFFLFGLNFGKY